MKKLLGFLAVALLASSALAPAAAAQSPYPYLIVYEDANGGGDHFTVHTYVPYTPYPNLGNISTGLTPTCNKALGLATTNWNDCISSIRLYIHNNSTLCVRLWQNTNYGGSWLNYYGGSNGYADGTLINMGSSWNDQISSINWFSC